ncbi:MAG TPA: cell wall-binding repeat-containing protein [Acidimicrobiales bacterium]|nr:cell wall-binding repeat-containing protein [Acidimicrobiales bacterium]
MRRLVALVAVLSGAIGLVPPAAALTDEPGTSRRVGASDDVVAAAVGLSQAAWDADAATLVVLARNDVFADALAGSALAADDGPVLYTATASLPAATRTEIERVLPANGCVIILGGAGAVSTGVEDAVRTVTSCVERIAGASRTETAVAIAERAGDKSTVLVARADSWADAATGGAYAAATGHPIVVTGGNALDPAVDAFLARTKPSRIVLLGGTGALGQAVADAAGRHATTTRVAGSSRAGTAAAIASRLWGPMDPAGVSLVNGYADRGWAYAIAGAVNAAAERAPQLYVEQGAVPAETSAHLDTVDDGFSLVVGPTTMVSDEVVAEVESTRGLTEPPGTAPLRYRDEVFDDVEEHLGVVYGSAVNVANTNEQLLMDVFEPAGDDVAARPTIVFVHGGGFYLGGTGEFERDVYLPLVRRGYVVASISYRLIPSPGCSGGPIDVCVTGMHHAREDAQTAVRFLRANAATYGIDTSRIAMMGTSAGAITSLHVGYLSEETPASAVRAVVAVAGANFLAPVTAGDAPALLMWGTADGPNITNNAPATVAAAETAGATVIGDQLAGVGHDVFAAVPDRVIDQTTSFLW